jgi:septum formation protein
VLASRSPQRRAILDRLGVDFSVRAADVEELEQGEPEHVATDNARRKAAAVAAARPDAVVLGADTVVCLERRIYGKPADEAAAGSTLRALSGKRHSVIGGICLIEPGGVHTAAARTEVELRELSDALIEWYLNSGEWRGRAGAYAIQGRGAALVRRIDGDYLNVVGLPVAALLELAPWLLPR